MCLTLLYFYNIQMKGGVPGTRHVGTLRVGDLLSALPLSSSSPRKRSATKRKDTMKSVRKTTAKKRTQRKRLTAVPKKTRRLMKEKRNDSALTRLFSGMGF